MALNSINNQTSNLSFKGKTEVDTDKRIRAQAFVNMSDDQLKQIALAKAVEKHNHREHKGSSLLTSLYALPLVDIAAKTVLEKGEAGNVLSAKVKTAARTGAGWAGGLALIGVYNIGKKFVVSKSSTLQNFEQNHPVANFLLDIGALFVGFGYAVKGHAVLKNKLTKAFPKAAEFLKGKGEKFTNWLDKTVINTKVLPKISEFAQKTREKAPFIGKVGDFVANNALWIAFFGGVFHDSHKNVKEQQRFGKDFEHTYEKLKDAQLKTAKHMTNVLSVERDVLAQKDIEESQTPIADELKEHMDKE